MRFEVAAIRVTKISTVLWVHKKLPQSTVKPILPINESYESKTGCNRTLPTVLWVPLKTLSEGQRLLANTSVCKQSLVPSALADADHPLSTPLWRHCLENTVCYPLEEIARGLLVSHSCCDPCRATQCRAHVVAANSRNFFRDVAGVSRYPDPPEVLAFSFSLLFSFSDFPYFLGRLSFILPPPCQCREDISLQNGSRYTGV